MSVRHDRESVDLSDLRVLIVIDRVEDVGGAEGSTTLILRGLHRAGVRVGAVGLDGVSIADRAELASEGVRFYEPSGSGRIAAIRCVLRAIHDLRPSLLHSTLARADMAARIAGLLSGTPVMTSIVNTQYGAEARAVSPSRLKLDAYRYVDGFLARHATFAFHAISNASADEAARALAIDRARITVVPRGRSDEQLGRRTVQRRDATRRALGLPDDAFVIVNVAREDLQKGQWFLVDALASINTGREHPAHLVVAGRRGTASADIDERVSATGQAQSVHRLGVRTDVPELLCVADVFAFPSLHEGLGGALLEALALEVPIVAFDDPAVCEAVGDAGVVVPMRNGEAFTTALADLLANGDERDALAARGRSRFEAHFTNDRYIAAMLELYTVVACSAREDYRVPLSWVRRRRQHVQ
jgi:glycosyltransferase involved in cell wall biosynthesis